MNFIINKVAEICLKYLSKGDKIYIEGKIKTRKWKAEDGNDRYTTEINVDQFTFLTTKKISESQNTLNDGSNPENQDLPF